MSEPERIKQAINEARKRFIECEPDNQPDYSELARDLKVPLKLISGIASKEGWENQHNLWWENEKRRRILAIQSSLETEYRKDLTAASQEAQDRQQFLRLIRLMMSKLEEKLIKESSEDTSFYHLAQGSSAIGSLWESYKEIQGELHWAISVLVEREVLSARVLSEIQTIVLEAEKFTVERLQTIMRSE
jgi:hypothetical protein